LGVASFWKNVTAGRFLLVTLKGRLGAQLDHQIGLAKALSASQRVAEGVEAKAGQAHHGKAPSD
jgi:hypothetical protein